MAKIHISSILKDVPLSPTLEIKAVADEMKKQGPIFDFGIGEMNPYIPLPDQLKEAMVDAIRANQTSYSNEQGDFTLRKALSDDFKKNFNLSYEPQQICICPGPKDALFKSMMVCLDPTSHRNRVIAFSPCYESFVGTPLLITHKPTIILETDEKCYPILEKLSSALQQNDNIAMIIINSPNNPTGAVYPDIMLKEIAHIVQNYPHIVVVSDEVYRVIRFDGETFNYSSIAHYLPEQTIVVGGMSKEVSGTGLRVGFAAGPEYIIKTMALVNSLTCSCTNLPTQKGYAAFLGYDKDLNERLRIQGILRERKELIVKLWNELPMLRKCKLGEPYGAFYIFPNIEEFLGYTTPDGTTITSDMDLSMFILKEGRVVTLPGTKFSKPGYMRLAYAASDLSLIHSGLIELNNVLMKLKKS